MEKEKKENSNVLLIVLAALTLVIAMVGATFAYFSATSTAESRNITTGELQIAATSSIENNKEIKPTKWDGSNESGINDENRKDIAVITLEVDTSGTTIDTSSYNIFLTTEGIKLNTTDKVVENQGQAAVELTGGKLGDVKWVLFDDNNTQIGNGDFTKSADGTDANIGDVKLLKVNNEKISIDPTKGSPTHTYKLYIWIQDDNNPQNKLQNLTINASLNVETLQDVVKE